jgi:long-chain acyl-CoA synthetase
MIEIPDYIKTRYWKDFLPPGITLEIDIPQDESLIELFENGAREYGDKVCLDFYGKKFTFNELDNLTRRFSTALIDLGVKKGDVVALWLPNCPHFSISYFGVIGVGATITAISPLFVAREMTYQIKDSGAKFLIIIDRFIKQFNRAMKAGLPLEKVIVVNVEGKKPEVAESDMIVHFNTLMEKFPEPDLEYDIEIEPKKDIAVIQYTGGTTGLPKGASLSHYNILANIYQINQISDYMKEEYIKDDLVAISVLPWYHIYGQTCELAQGPMGGSKAFVLPTFDMNMIIDIIKKHKPNTFLGVTTMFINLLNFPAFKDVDLSSLKYSNVGAGALPIELAKAWEERTGFAMGEGYGLSEASPVVTNAPPWAKKKPGSCGHPIANTLVGIWDNQKQKFLPIGEAGELVVAGPQVMLGYYNRPEENEKTFFEAGGHRWLRTGDFAKLDEEGYIFLLDRVKDLIKYKGHSVYPREIEEVLYEHPAILECAVFGIEDPIKGEEILTHIILRPEYREKVTEEEILEWAKENMAAYKYPRQIKFVRSLPKSAVGKILRRVIRDKETKKASK